MLETDKFAFIELPRTGSTHTMYLLKGLFGGKRSRMHLPADDKTLARQRSFIGTVRNPWDWYISHWSMYRGGVGSLHRHSRRSRETIRSGPAKGEIHDPEVWLPCISKTDPPDVSAFRLWVKTLCTPEIMRVTLPSCFGKSGLLQFAGIYSHMYVSIFCTNQHILNQPGAVTDLASLKQFVFVNRYAKYMVRTENLAKDLEAALQAIGMDLTAKQIKTIHEVPARNRTNRTLPLAAYYDQETIDLVAERDRFIIDQYGYSYPPPVRDELGRQTLPSTLSYKKPWNAPEIS